RSRRRRHALRRRWSPWRQPPSALGPRGRRFVFHAATTRGAGESGGRGRPARLDARGPNRPVRRRRRSRRLGTESRMRPDKGCESNGAWRASADEGGREWGVVFQYDRRQADHKWRCALGGGKRTVERDEKKRQNAC